jgi:kanamycin kinase
MKLTPITINIADYPAELQELLSGAALYDSSSSPNAKVIFIDKDGGYFLKSAPAGTVLREESLMTEYFYKKKLAPKVAAFIQEHNGCEFLLTEKLPGDDCTDAKYLERPERLCDTIAEKLAFLHSLDCSDCPVNRGSGYVERAKNGYLLGKFDKDLFPHNWGYASAGEARRVVEERGHLFKSDTLLHGDYCLPNIVLDDWNLSGFIDLGSGGVGDRHIDIFWGAWTLTFNLKTDKYRDRFLDAYGRDKRDEEALCVVAACEVFL